MSNEEKILNAITQMQGDFKQMQGNIKDIDKRLIKIEKNQVKSDMIQKEISKDIKVIKEDVKYLHTASNEAFRDIGTLDKRTDHIIKPVFRSGTQ
ncbi:MAG: hypothetical protein FWB80_04465 [Defluviitaleaceae bacterium]|nr:hypothetical protein [Defluviitaleaceae bacterium]